MQYALDRAPELRMSYNNSVLLANRVSPIKEFGREWPLQFRSHGQIPAPSYQFCTPALFISLSSGDDSSHVNSMQVSFLSPGHHSYLRDERLLVRLSGKCILHLY